MKSTIQAIAALLITSVTFVACSSDDDFIIDVPQQPAAPQTYTLTVQALKSSDVSETRALSPGDNTINASWQQGEAVTVYNVTRDAALSGSLIARYSGATTTLKGTLTGTIENGDELKLKFLSPTYSGQNGTIEYIASHCDYAEATAFVTSIIDQRVTAAPTSFTNQQTIVKFTLKNATGNALPCNPEALRVSDGTNTIVMTGIPGSTYSNEKNGTGVLYVAMPGFSNKTVIVDAYCNEKLYTYTKTDVSLANSSYYNVTVNMSPATNVDLTRVISNLELQDGDITTGTLGSGVRVSIASGATVTLSDATINGWRDYNKRWAGLNCRGNATIVLADGTTNTMRGFYDSPGIHIPSGKTLTIQGTGTLNASSSSDGAGIGGGWSLDCGNILIKSGIINATGGWYSAGIGSGYFRSCGSIVIQGGTVTTSGGNYGAGIGSGHIGFCSSIEIQGGTVNTAGGDFAAGIGTGGGMDGEEEWSYYDDYFEEEMWFPEEPAMPSTCGTITISGGIVDARGGNSAAGIGTGEIGNCGDITITSGVTRVTATSGSDWTHSIGRGDDGWFFESHGQVEDFSVYIGGESVGYISDSPYTYQP